MPSNTKTTKENTSRPTVFHVVSGGVSLQNEQGKTYVTMRGDQFNVTEKMVAASLSRFGDSWLDLINNPSAQIERWGEVKLASGPCPFTVTPEPSGLYVREKETQVPFVYPPTHTVEYKNPVGAQNR